MIKHIITLFLLLTFLVSCSDSIKDVTKGDDKGKDDSVTLGNLNNVVLEYSASADVVKDIEIGPIFLSDGNLITSSNTFSIISNESEKNRRKLTVDTNSDTIDGFSTNPITVSGDSQGKIRFQIQVPRTADDYTITVRSNQYSSLGLVKVKVKPGSVANIGSVKSSAFKDAPPFNGKKDPAEPYAAIREHETEMTIGPIVDEFGNKINSGRLDVSIDGGVLGGDVGAMDDDLIVERATFEIIDGEARFPVISFHGENSVRIVSAMEGAAESEEDFILLPVGQFVDQTIIVIDSIVSIIGLTEENYLDFGIVFVGRSSTRTVSVRNMGNAKITNLNTIVDAPFLKVGGTCDDGRQLSPNEECSIEIKYEAHSRVFGSGNLTISGKFSGVNISEEIIRLSVQAAMPANIQLSLENNLIEFDPTPVGEVSTKVFTIVNIGDVPVENLRFVQPVPYPGQNIGFYTFISKPSSIPNEDPSAGEHCGQLIEPQKRCKIYVEFFPQGRVSSDLLAGNIEIGQDTSVTVFVKGKSFVNNFEKTIPISAAKYDIRKDELDNVEVIVGPVRDINGEAVANQDVLIEVFSWENEDKTLKRIQGHVSSNRIIIGSDNSVIRIRTDDQGYANFVLKSRIQDLVGQLIVEARVVDSENNVLTKGVNDTFKFTGVNLQFDLPVYNFARSVIGLDSLKTVKIKNEGSIAAQNIGVIITEEKFFINNNGTCTGLSTTSLALAPDEECEFELGFHPTDRTSYFDYLKIVSSNFGSKGFADMYGVGITSLRLNAETPKFVATHVMGQPNPLSGYVVFSNIGEETATALTTYMLDENHSFDYRFDCEQVEAGRTCTLNFEYNPEIIPSGVLNTQLVISGVGEQAGLSHEIRIPIQIVHSSLKFTSTDPGINIGVCYELEIVGFDTQEDDLDYSKDISLDLSNEGAPGGFFFDHNCTTPISSILMPANTYKTNKFYYKGIQPGFHVLSANSSEIASAIKGFKIYKQPSAIKVVSGNAQNAFTEKPLNPPLIIKAVDDEGNGVPNIPLNLDILEDISLKTQLIKNPNFLSGIADWTVSSGAQWFKGFGGVLRLASLTSVENAVSSNIAVTAGQAYYYSVRVSESIGTPATSSVKVELLNSSNNQVIQTNIIEGKRIQVFKFVPNGSQSIVKIRLSTIGFSLNTAAFIDSVYFTNALASSNGNTLRYGSIENPSPFMTGFKGEGEFNVDYKTPEIPSIISINATSSFPTLAGASAFMNLSVEFPTNITGALGDLTISTTGATLTKNGGNNLAAISGMAGYSWDNATKTLNLPGNQSYDFNSITINPGATLKFKAPSTKKFEWTSVYAKQGCLIDGTLQVNGYRTDNQPITVNAVGIDGETLTVDLEPYADGKIGGDGGAGGYFDWTRYRDHYYHRRKYKSNHWHINGWYGWVTNNIFNQEPTYTRIPGFSGTGFKGGNGASGRPGKYGTTIRPNGGTGGLGGDHGNDGGLLFLHCFLSLQGNGKIDVSGAQGMPGGNGIAGSYFDTGSVATGYAGGYVVSEIRRTLTAGGGGGGSGGNGGRGGMIISKSKNFNNTIQYKFNGGAGGAMGASGPSYNNNAGLKGGNGSIGNQGETGSCKEVFGASITDC